jgi:hypothetical protein
MSLSCLASRSLIASELDGLKGGLASLVDPSFSGV